MKERKSRAVRALLALLSLSAMISTLVLPIPGGSPADGSATTITSASVSASDDSTDVPRNSTEVPLRPSDVPVVSTDRVQQAMARMPVYFEENHGQFNDKVRYYARGTGGYDLFLTATDAVYVLTSRETDLESTDRRIDRLDDPIRGPERETKPAKAVAVYMTLVGANPDAVSSGTQQLEHRTNYFKGEESNWRTNIPNYGQVRMSDVYAGIDTVWHGLEGGGVRYDFVVEPFAEPSQIRWKVKGAEAVELDGEGNLLIKTEFGEIRQNKPFTYQEIDGFRHEIESRFVIWGNDVRFEIGEYERSKPLTIDPTTTTDSLGFSTFLGGSGNDEGLAVAADVSGSVLATGRTQSTTFPTTPGTFDSTHNGSRDVFVTKVNAAGSALIYSTFLGGSDYDEGRGISIDSSGNAYLTGMSRDGAVDFPATPGAFDTTHNGVEDVFVAKLNPDGSTLIYSTFLGGSSNDIGYGIAVDVFGNAVVTGSSFDGNASFPVTPGAFDTSQNGQWDAFVTKLNPSGTGLLYSTFVGGSDTDTGFGIALDAEGNAFLAGRSRDGVVDLPTTPGAFDANHNGGEDGFVTKLNPQGSGLIYSTFIGSNGTEIINDVAVDTSGNAVVSGQTSSTSFPTTPGSFDTTFNGGENDAFVAKLNLIGSDLVFSTLIGGISNENGNGVEVDSFGNAFVIGETASTNFPTTSGAYDTSHNGTWDVFVTRLNATGSGLVYSTFVGGINNEVGYGIALDSSGNAYLTGSNFAGDFPTTLGAYDTTQNGFSDVFVTKFNRASFCAYSISPGTVSILSGGGNGVFNLTTDPGCSWTAVSNAPWITITGGNSGSGSGEVTFVVESNSLNARSGSITAGGKTFTVNQASGCAFTLSSSSTDIGAGGGAGSFSINGIPACNWTAVSNNSWITITGGTSGSGSGNVSFSIAPNNGPPRTGTITAGGQAFTVNQATGCAYSFSSSGTTFPAAGGVGGFNVTTVAGCSWTASTNSGWITIDSGTGNSSGSVTFTVQQNTGAARSGTITVGPQTFTVNQLARPAARALFDFDGDSKTDISIFRPSVGQWWLSRSADGVIAHTFGNSSDTIVPGDYTGDGKADVAIFRPSESVWYVLRSENYSFYSFPFGSNGDLPVPADYDGDGKTDAAVFRPSDSTWYIQRSSGGTTIQTFGASTDRPVPADYDGDGKTDIAIYRPSLGQWWINRSTAGLIVHTFGNSADRNVPGDYTGDGKADVAIWRPSSGEWFILRSEDFSFYSFPFGVSTDLPVPGDYDGDGRTDAGVFRPSPGTWYVNRSTSGLLIQGFGTAGDLPVPGVFVR